VCRYVSGYWARNEGDVHAARHQSPLVRATSHRAQRRESHICGKNRLEKVYISASASDCVCVCAKEVSGFVECFFTFSRARAQGCGALTEATGG
jgi:hypothetical protein